MSTILYYLSRSHRQDQGNEQINAERGPRASLAGRTFGIMTGAGRAAASGISSLAIGTLKGAGSLALGAAKGAGRGVAAATSYASRTYVEYMDPLIGEKKYEITSHVRDQVRPLNVLSDNKTYITEETSIEELQAFATSLESQIEDLQDEIDEISDPFVDASSDFSETNPEDLEDFTVVELSDTQEPQGVLGEEQIETLLKLEEKSDKLQTLKGHIETLIQKKEELEEMRSGNWAVGAGLRRTVQLGSLAQMARANHIEPHLQAASEGFDTRSLLADNSGQAPANLFDHLMPGMNRVVDGVAAPIIREIQGEVSWATQEAHFERVLLETAQSIQAFITNTTQNEAALEALQELSEAAKQLSAFEEKKHLEEQIDLLENHYESGAQTALTKARGDLAQLSALIAQTYPEEDLESSEERFIYAQLRYETGLLEGELLSDKVSHAQGAALNNLTKFLLRKVPASNSKIAFLRALKKIIHWVIFKIVRLVVKDVVHTTVDAQMVEEVAADVRKQVEELINHPDYAPYIQGPQRKLLPALIESQVKALIPHILEDLPQRLADYKKDHRQAPLDATEAAEQQTPQYSQTAMQFQETTTAIADSILDLIDRETSGASITGFASLDARLVDMGRERARQMIHNTNYVDPLKRIGANIHTWIGDSPSAGHKPEEEPIDAFVEIDMVDVADMEDPA